MTIGERFERIDLVTAYATSDTVTQLDGGVRTEATRSQALVSAIGQVIQRQQ